MRGSEASRARRSAARAGSFFEFKARASVIDDVILVAVPTAEASSLHVRKPFAFRFLRILNGGSVSAYPSQANFPPVPQKPAVVSCPHFRVGNEFQWLAIAKCTTNRLARPVGPGLTRDGVKISLNALEQKRMSLLVAQS